MLIQQEPGILCHHALFARSAVQLCCHLEHKLGTPASAFKFAAQYLGNELCISFRCVADMVLDGSSSNTIAYVCADEAKKLWHLSSHPFQSVFNASVAWCQQVITHII